MLIGVQDDLGIDGSDYYSTCINDLPNDISRLIMKIINEIILFLIQWLHWTFLIMTIVSVPLLILLEPFYISLPICAWIMHLGFSRTLDCPWTRLENRYRSRTGRKEIGGFISHNLKVLGLKKRKNK